MGLSEGNVHRWLWSAAALFLVLVAMALWAGNWRFAPPQMGTDEEVFKTVDALFTAITSRDQKQLDECDRRLIAHRDAGKLPKKSADFLESVIRQVRTGKWEPAAKRLYDFMYGQKRR